MATRGPPGARGMGNRFAQFKLVLLGMAVSAIVWPRAFS